LANGARPPCNLNKHKHYGFIKQIRINAAICLDKKRVPFSWTPQSRYPKRFIAAWSRQGFGAAAPTFIDQDARLVRLACPPASKYAILPKIDASNGYGNVTKTWRLKSYRI
jgi:hypothetical protein